MFSSPYNHIENFFARDYFKVLSCDLRDLDLTAASWFKKKKSL